MKVHLDIKHSCAFKIPILARVFLRPWLALSQRVAVRVPVKKNMHLYPIEDEKL